MRVMGGICFSPLESQHLGSDTTQGLFFFCVPVWILARPMAWSKCLPPFSFSYPKTGLRMFLLCFLGPPNVCVLEIFIQACPLALSPLHESPSIAVVYDVCTPQPGLQCADLVFDEMQRIAAQCEGTELSRFPTLRDRIVEVGVLSVFVEGSP